MREFNAFDVRCMVEELQQCVGSRINKIYEPDGVLFQLHKSGVGKFLLRVSGNVLWLTAHKPEMPKRLSRLCAKLRKHVEGKKLTALEQVNSERIVKLTLETQKETYYVFAELFGKGNIILADETGRVLIAKEERVWKDREIKQGVQYQLPPAKKDVFSLAKEDMVKDEKKLAVLGLGTLLAREVLARGGDVGAYQSLLKERCSPVLYSSGEFGAFPLKQLDGTPKKYESFSALVDELMGVSAEEQKEKRVDKAFEKKRQKLLEVIELQRQTGEKLEARAVELQRKGEAVYEHFQELSEVLAAIKGNKKPGVPHVEVKKVDRKTGKVLVKMEK